MILKSLMGHIEVSTIIYDIVFFLHKIDYGMAKVSCISILVWYTGAT